MQVLYEMCEVWSPVGMPESCFQNLIYCPQEALIPLLSRNVGFGMGLEFREGTHVLPLPGSGKAAAAGEDGAPRVRAGMVFNVCVGVAGLTNADASDPKAKNYALQVRAASGTIRGQYPNLLWPHTRALR